MKIRLLLSLFFIQTLCASAANLTVRQCLPLDGSKDVDINAAVKIIFTENIALGEGRCLFNGAPVASSVTAVIASLEIPALDYGTTYTVYVPEGVFVSKNDKSKTNEVITFSFTTKARPMPEFFSGLFSELLKMQPMQSITIKYIAMPAKKSSFSKQCSKSQSLIRTFDSISKRHVALPVSTSLPVKYRALLIAIMRQLFLQASVLISSIVSIIIKYMSLILFLID